MTGYKGEAHITAVDDAMFHVSVFGDSEWVFETGDKLTYEIESNNKINLKSGDIMMQGRHGRIERNKVDACVIDNGTQGKIRHDIIAVRYEKDSGGKEKMSTVVIKGTAGSAGKDPALQKGNINADGKIHEMPLYRVVINGLNITSVVKMFNYYPKLRRIRSGTALPSEAVEGDIFLLYES